jgi:Ca2+-binding EF-hand superfamily protein
MKGMPADMLNQIDVRMIKGQTGNNRDKFKSFKRVYDQDQIKAVRKLFSKYDKDGSGSIDPEEFVVMMEAVGKSLFFF